MNLNRIAIAGLTLLIWTAPANGDMGESDKSALQGHLADLASRIEAARSDAAQYELGSVLNALANARAETYALTAAMVEARLAAEETSASVEVTLPVVAVDPEAAAQIKADMIAQEEIIAQAKAEVASTRGLIQAIALSRVQAEKLTLARLRSALMQARYGAMIPAEIASSTSSSNVSSPPKSERIEAKEGSTVEAPFWADQDHPEIDYSSIIFEVLHNKGFKIHGWWAILKTKAEIDDSPRVLALQVERKAMSKNYSSSTSGLQIGCSEGTIAFIYDINDYLLTDVRRGGINVTYRIDESPAVTERWSETTDGESAGVFDRDAVPFLRKIYEAEKIFLRVVERDGERHDATFDLSGVREAIDAAASACGISMLDLGPNEYRAIQEMLNSAGFNAGAPDGIWGATSKTALQKFQHDRGLPATGAVDANTLKEMGLKF